MKVLSEILKSSKPIDENFKSISDQDLDRVEITFKVPQFHPRSKVLSEYKLKPLSLDNLLKDKTYKLTKKHLFLIDELVSKQDLVKSFINKNKIDYIIIKSIESLSKTKPFLDNLINEKIKDTNDITIVVIGGGLILNIGAYISERISANLILMPTTVLSMADGSGGKVRINFIDEKRAYKHFYKSFYEPNAIFIEPKFLDSLPKEQIQIGLVEIIKHGLFQSEALYNFLLKSGQALFIDKEKLKKAIIWTENLKRLCLEFDMEENENGSRRILRGGHDFSDRIEEDFRLKIPHGIAVAIGIVHQLEMEKDEETLQKAIKIFKILEIPYRLEDWNKN